MVLNLFSHFVDMADRSLKVGIVGYGHLGEFSSENFCFNFPCIVLHIDLFNLHLQYCILPDKITIFIVYTSFYIFKYTIFSVN